MLGKLIRSLSRAPHRVRGLTDSALERYRRHQSDESLAELRSLTNRFPGAPYPLLVLGTELIKLGQADEASEVLSRAAAIEPDSVDIVSRYAVALHKQNNLAGAKQYYERAWDLDPGSPTYFLNLLKLDLDICDWEGVEKRVAYLRESAEKDPIEYWSQLINPLVSQLVDVSPSLRRQLAAFRACGRGGGVEKSAATVRQRPRGRLRVGYLSCDFRDQPVSHLCSRIFALHDRSQFEVYAFSYGKNDGSIYRQRAESDSDQFIDLQHRDPSYFDKTIRSVDPDIVIDLSGFGGLGNPRLLAGRPAPIQINYLGYPGTVAPFMDYVVADHVSVPAEHESHFFERVLRMPHSYMITDDEQGIAARTPRRNELGLPDEAVVYCSFNDSSKIDRRSFSTWLRILHAVPDSVLWLRARNTVAKQNLLDWAKRDGIEPNRMFFSQRADSKQDYLAMYRAADLFLDSFQYNAHTTACDALWAGLPLITCLGGHFPARTAGSLLTSLGMPELVCSSISEYETLAVTLGKNPSRLAATRDRLSIQRAQSPLFQTRAWVRDFENLLHLAVETKYENSPISV